MFTAIPRPAFGLVLGLVLAAGSAYGQSGNFGLELNSAQQVESLCRLTFVATNNTGVNLSAVSYEVVIWDSLGAVPNNGFLEFQFGRMPVGKTKVVQFDLPDRSCTSISRVLINDQTECSSPVGEQDFCLTGLVANSRTTILFGK